MSLFFLLYFALSTFGTQTQFNRFIVYGLLVALCATGLNSIMIRFGEPKEEGSVPDWDEDLKASHGVWIFLGLAAIVVITTFILSSGRLFYIVTWNEIQSLGQLSVIPTSSDFYLRVFQETVWQTFIVSYSEESLKLAVILVFTRALQNYQPLDQIIGAGFPILIWAQFHSMLAYGQNTMMILAAFLAGVVLYIMLRITGSVLVPVIIHAGYNLFVTVPVLGGQTIVTASSVVQQMSVYVIPLFQQFTLYFSSVTLTWLVNVPL
jgi:hypothetical protein